MFCGMWLSIPIGLGKLRIVLVSLERAFAEKIAAMHGLRFLRAGQRVSLARHGYLDVVRKRRASVVRSG